MVPDLGQSREFYVNRLGCDTGEWIDFFSGIKWQCIRRDVEWMQGALIIFFPFIEEDE